MQRRAGVVRRKNSQQQESIHWCFLLTHGDEIMPREHGRDHDRETNDDVHVRDRELQIVLTFQENGKNRASFPQLQIIPWIRNTAVIRLTHLSSVFKDKMKTA